MRLRTLLLLAALLPVLLVSSLLTWPVVELRRSELMEQARLRTLQAGRSSELLIAERLGFAEALIGLLAERPTLTRAMVGAQRADVQGFLAQTRIATLFDLLTVLDTSGAMIGQDGETLLWDPAQDHSQPLSVRGQPGVGMVATMAAPILIDGERGGTLIGTFAIGQPFVAGARQRSGLDQSLLVDGTLVTSSLPDRERAGPGPLLPIAAPESLEPAPAEREIEIQGVPYLVHYQPVQSHADLQVGAVEVLLPLAPVRAAQRETTLALLSSVSIAVLTAALLSWLLAHRITRSIGTLGQAAGRIGAGELATPVAVPGPMEIVQLSAAVDRMRAQLAATHAALAAETARYLNILESTSDAILLLDQAGQVILINHGAERLLGCERPAAAGAPLSEVVRLHGDGQLELERIPLNGTCHLAIQPADGRVITVAASRSAIQASQGPGEQIVVLRDVSDAVALGAMKEAFLANVTHEFRTPLAALIASLEILRDEHGDLSPGEQQQMLGALQNSVQRLDTLVQNLLDSASIQAGYFRVRPEITRLMPLIAEALELMEPLVRQRAQTITVTAPPDLRPVLADERRLVQVLVNLLSNASKFGPRGDSLLITVDQQGDMVSVEVTDHGPGVADSRQSNLFERFLRPGSETVGAQGAGLGLAIVKAVVEAHGGSISVQSTGARGTTFRFTLPVAAAKPSEDAYANLAR